MKQKAVCKCITLYIILYKTELKLKTFEKQLFGKLIKRVYNKQQ